MSYKYFIYYVNHRQRDEWYKTLMQYANKTKIGIVSNLLPIIGNLSVSENMLVGAYYHHKISYKEGMKLVTADLKRFGMEGKEDYRSNLLDDFEKLIVKYLQVKYICPEWIVFLSPRRMYAAEYEERFHEFLRCEQLEKSVIIENELNRKLFSDMHEYTEKDFNKWVTQDLKI
ncbi:MAG: hypothetical protein AB7U93_07720 [Deferribacterales bacterium]|jgi:ABC-type uncharacterized transport system ATPase subunit